MWEEIDVINAIDDLSRRGFTEHFVVVGGALCGLEGGKRFAPQELIIRDYHRSEGVSDPGDMAIVYGHSGSLVRHPALPRMRPASDSGRVQL
jgi:hypothetical protein